MKALGKMPPYSYHVAWSNQDREFVATFLELPELSGLGPTIADAIGELNEALGVWLEAAKKEGFELPDAAMEGPCVILDARFMGKDPYIMELARVLPEDFIPASELRKAVSASGAQSLPSKVIKIERQGQVVEL